MGLRRAGGTDHLPFQYMGLPGFQFIQDPLDYGSRLHHTNIDTASHVYEKDLKQAAIIMASFLWHAANRDERQFTCPESLDLEREKPGSHMGFGSGVHHCLGAPLARDRRCTTRGWTHVCCRRDRPLRRHGGCPH